MGSQFKNVPVCKFWRRILLFSNTNLVEQIQSVHSMCHLGWFPVGKISKVVKRYLSLYLCMGKNQNKSCLMTKNRLLSEKWTRKRAEQSFLIFLASVWTRPHAPLLVCLMLYGYIDLCGTFPHYIHIFRAFVFVCMESDQSLRRFLSQKCFNIQKKKAFCGHLKIDGSFSLCVFRIRLVGKQSPKRILNHQTE